MFETCTWNISTLSWNLKIMHASVSVTTSEFARERRFPPVTLYTFYWGETTLNLSHSNDSASLRRRRRYLSVDKQNTRPLCLLTFIACHINNPTEGWWKPPQASAIVLVPKQHARPFNIPSSATKNKLYIPPLHTHQLALALVFRTAYMLRNTALCYWQYAVWNGVVLFCSVPDHTELVNKNMADHNSLRSLMPWRKICNRQIEGLLSTAASHGEPRSCYGKLTNVGAFSGRFLFIHSVWI